MNDFVQKTACYILYMNWRKTHLTHLPQEHIVAPSKDLLRSGDLLHVLTLAPLEGAVGSCGVREGWSADGRFLGVVGLLRFCS